MRNLKKQVINNGNSLCLHIVVHTVMHMVQWQFIDDLSSYVVFNCKPTSALW